MSLNTNSIQFNLNKLTKIDSINEKLSQIYISFPQKVGNQLKLRPIDNSVMDQLKAFKVMVKPIEFRQNTDQFKCLWPQCQYKNDYKEMVENHQLIHKNVRQFNCNSVINQIKECKVVIKRIEFRQNTNQFICFWPKCQFKADSRKTLESHKLIHINVRQFKCNSCGKSFKFASLLKNHQLVHSNQRPFVCHRNGCGKQYKTNGDLNKHKRRVHLKERKFECDYNDCKQRFFSKTQLEDHKRIHSGEKPFVCDHNDCNKRFNTKGNLKRHQKTH